MSQIRQRPAGEGIYSDMEFPKGLAGEPSIGRPSVWPLRTPKLASVRVKGDVPRAHFEHIAEPLLSCSLTDRLRIEYLNLTRGHVNKI